MATSHQVLPAEPISKYPTARSYHLLPVRVTAVPFLSPVSGTFPPPQQPVTAPHKPSSVFLLSSITVLLHHLREPFNHL
ncbi:hypothetical protein NQZ68_001089 [Dissostichus eleginoides]|nr:hypothetical protein NQZ68_001089 [Dissostichus eleginoides]